jgi:aminoglycoside phosphotransferase
MLLQHCWSWPHARWPLGHLTLPHHSWSWLHAQRLPGCSTLVPALPLLAASSNDMMQNQVLSAKKLHSVDVERFSFTFSLINSFHLENQARI